MYIPHFRIINKLQYPQAAIKFSRNVIELACANKNQAIEQERNALLKTLFGRKAWSSGRVSKNSDEESKAAKPGTFTDLINSPKASLACGRIGEQYDRLNIFYRHLANTSRE